MSIDHLHQGFRNLSEANGILITPVVDAALRAAAEAVTEVARANPLPQPSDDDWSMYSDSGNEAVEFAVKTLEANVRAGQVNRDDLPDAIRTMRTGLETLGYPEVFDTEPRNLISDHFDSVSDDLGWARQPHDFFGWPRDDFQTSPSDADL